MSDFNKEKIYDAVVVSVIFICIVVALSGFSSCESKRVVAEQDRETREKCFELTKDKQCWGIKQ